MPPDSPPRPGPSSSRTARSTAVTIVVLLLLGLLIGAGLWSVERVPTSGDMTVRRYEAPNLEAALLPPSWWRHTPDERARADVLAHAKGYVPCTFLGTDRFGRDMLARSIAGGAVSLLIGLAAAVITVVIGTAWGVCAGLAGGRTDAALMRLVDILFGLPTILLVVLLAVAVDGIWQRLVEEIGHDLDPGLKQQVNILVLMVAIGGVSWLTMARVIRGEVLSLRERPFMEACRATAVPWTRQLTRHLLPNLVGPIAVYAALAVPAAILTESFLSFLGIGVQPPVPSWGNLASDGLSELNLVRSRWWLLAWPSLFVGVTLIMLNLAGDRLRERLDPMRRARGAAGTLAKRTIGTEARGSVLG